MHYRQTILDTLVAALEAEPSLTGKVTDRRAFPEEEALAVRVWMLSETRDEEREVMNSTQEPRILVLRVQVLAAGHNVQSDLNAALEAVERASRPGLADVADCTYLESANFDIEAEQDREVGSAELDYSVYYVTAVGDPATRV